MASLQTGVAGDPAEEVPTHATRRPQTYRLVAGPILGSFTFRVTAALFPKSTIKPQLPQPQVTATLGAF